MTKEEIFSIWAPDESPWATWAKPVLFAYLDFAILHLPSIDLTTDATWSPPADVKTALVLDLPGAEGVLNGLAAASVGYRPVPLYNAVPLPFAEQSHYLRTGRAVAAVDVVPILTALGQGAERLASLQLRIVAPPAFLLDANRRGDGRTMRPDEFDNRSVSFTTDFPSANFLVAHGIQNVLLVQKDSLIPQSDLAHTLCRWQDGGLKLERLRLDSASLREPFEVIQPSWYGAMFQRMLSRIGLRRSAKGGFGAWVPESSAGGEKAKLHFFMGNCREIVAGKPCLQGGARHAYSRMHKHSLSKTAEEGSEIARSARLHYVTEVEEGFRRALDGKGFRYLTAEKKPITEASVLRRIKALVIPPAWTEVWICPLENGHLQATGRDARGRKQYRYHRRWREVRDETKYNRMIEFAKVLARVRKRVARDLRAPHLSRAQVLAAVVQLLEVSLIRVGNDEYAHQNHSYGLTTMKNRHASIHHSTIQFHFRGKSGKEHTVEIHDARLAKIVRDCREIPGQDLFQYLDPDGHRQHIRSDDVNEYLREISGGDFTAKDFRTWAGTVLAGIALGEFQKFDSQAQAKKNLIHAIESVAARLGNTPAICKKCYIHPEILDGYLQGATIETIRANAEAELRNGLHHLHPEEAAVVAFLQTRLTQKKQPLATVLKKSIRQLKRRR